MSSRHSAYPHQPDDLAAKTREFEPSRAGAHPAAGPFAGDAGEELAEKIIAAGSDSMVEKSERRFGPNAAPSGPGGLLGADPAAVANKLIKEGARELARAEAHPHKGGPAALAQTVAAHKDDAASPAHAVAERVRERVAATEAHAEHHTFVGVNPQAGSDHDQRERHMRKGDAPGHSVLTASARGEGSPDVRPPRHVPRSQPGHEASDFLPPRG